MLNQNIETKTNIDETMYNWESNFKEISFKMLAENYGVSYDTLEKLYPEKYEMFC